VSTSMFPLIREIRIECAREHEPEYDKQILKNGWYGDAHLCRPYSAHKPYIDGVLSDIPKCI
jgi:hypothetical protein